MYKKVIGLVLAGMMSLSVVGCGSNEVEYQEPQVQQEQTVDEINVLFNISEDLKFYEMIAESVSNSNTSTREGAKRSYDNCYENLQKLRSYENCYETGTLKKCLENMLISGMEMFDCIYQMDLYGAEKALSDVEINVNMYQQELDILTEKYCGENI